MNVFIFSLIILFFVLPIGAFLGLVSYILWYTLNSNSGVRLAVSWRGKLLRGLCNQGFLAVHTQV